MSSVDVGVLSLKSETRYVLQRRVLYILERHYGHRNAIKAMELARMLDMRDDRQIQLAIEALIADGIPVCSSCSIPMGYFLPETRQEAEDYKHQLRGRALGNYHRYRNFKRAFQSWFYGELQRRLL